LTLHNASNVGKHMFLEEIDNKLLIKVKKRKIVNNSVFIDVRDMCLRPLDASCNDELNELCYVSL